MSNKNNNDTLNGGREVSVTVYGEKPGTLAEETWFVRQVPVTEYRALFKISDDEIALNAKVCSKTEAQLGKLVPESYQNIHRVVQEVNEHGFFIYRVRQLQKGSDSLNELPPEMVTQLIQSVLPKPSLSAPLPAGSPGMMRPQ